MEEIPRSSEVLGVYSWDVGTELHQIRNGPRRNLMKLVPIEVHALRDFSRNACRLRSSFYEECLPPCAMMLLRPSDFVPNPTSIFGLCNHIPGEYLNQAICLLEIFLDLLRWWTWFSEILEPYDLKADSSC